jgi:hypothetical protein
MPNYFTGEKKFGHEYIGSIGLRIILILPLLGCICRLYMFIRLYISPTKNSLQNLTYFRNVISNPVMVKIFDNLEMKKREGNPMFIKHLNPLKYTNWGLKP